MDKNLENRIANIEKWIEDKKKQQISFPLDFSSINTLITQSDITSNAMFMGANM